ncbi:HlyD family efflux transporter periplasmic adaptor subunit [Vibrio sp. D173a]|uniref:HlyD family secretion protein n=1 Tax=Vibrio sp. D173a TaxID=2836349 RepID=UPI002552B2C3|nr:HlyD family efflux transporter periplasmic adaptor subunit [Vibrio sp. D173a]MDK9754081.1 HlyD family efflux transporter periplasmic adaptor subunit [Vibrio sp. D173a]
MRQFYREEYLTIKTRAPEARILIRSSYSQSAMILVCIIIFLALFLLGFFGEYTRKASLQGVVNPYGGMVNVQSGSTGYIEELLAKEGEVVVAGQAIYKVNTERHNESGEPIKPLLNQSYNAQTKIIRDRIVQEQKRVGIELNSLNDDIDNLSVSIQNTQRIVSLSKQELELRQALFADKKKLLKLGHISEVEYANEKLKVNEVASRYESNLLNYNAKNRELAALKNAVESTEINSAITIKDLDRQLEVVEQERSEFLYQTDTRVVAPITGVVASVLVKEGHSVIAGQTLLVIVPEGEVFVEVYAPSRDIGFINVGQKVKLRFEAFPYQKFGVQGGVVESVSRTAVSPDVITNQRLIKADKVEGLYQVRITLNKQTITAYGREELLKSGMAVTADVEVDTRKLYEWVLEPMYSIKGRLE